MIEAKNKGVNLTTFDSKEELEKIKLHYQEANLVLRIKTDDKSSLIQLSKKFGASQNQWEMLITKCKELNLNLVGVSFHVGTGSYDTTTFAKAISDSAEIFTLASKYGFDLTLLDIGGGFPGNDSAEPSFEEFADIINISIEKFFKNKKNLKIIAEPGRYFAESCLICVAKIISRKHWDNQALLKESQEVQKILEGENLHSNSLFEIEKDGDDDIEKSKKTKYFINESTTLSFANSIVEATHYKPMLIQDHQNQQEFESEIYGNSGCEYELIV